MKKLLLVCLLGLVGMVVWNIRTFQTDTKPEAEPTPVQVDTPSEATPMPEPSPTPNYPSRQVFLKALGEVNAMLTDDIGPAAPSAVPPPLDVGSELNELWRLGQLMHEGGALDGKEAQSVVRMITLLREINEQRNLYEIRYEALYNRYSQKRMSGMESGARMTYARVNEDWKEAAQPKAQEVSSRRRALDTSAP